MRIVHKVVSNEKQLEYIEFMKKFDYELLERFIGEKTTDLHFIQNLDKPYSKELRKLEKKYFSYEHFSIVPTLILTLCGIGCITAFLILKLQTPSNFDYVFWFLCLMLPAILCIAGAVAIFFYKYYTVFKDMNKTERTKKEILDKIAKLKENK